MQAKGSNGVNGSPIVSRDARGEDVLMLMSRRILTGVQNPRLSQCGPEEGDRHTIPTPRAALARFTQLDDLTWRSMTAAARSVSELRGAGETFVWLQFTAEWLGVAGTLRPTPDP